MLRHGGIRGSVRRAGRGGGGDRESTAPRATACTAAAQSDRQPPKSPTEPNRIFRHAHARGLTFQRGLTTSRDPRLVARRDSICARTDARTVLSPHGAFRFSSLQPRRVRFAGRFAFSQCVAACSAGLLIPRSQVRFLPGPCDLQRFFGAAHRSRLHVCVRPAVHTAPSGFSSLHLLAGRLQLVAARFSSSHGFSVPSMCDDGSTVHTLPET
jgi:hypothetical protein